MPYAVLPVITPSTHRVHAPTPARGGQDLGVHQRHGLRHALTTVLLGIALEEGKEGEGKEEWWKKMRTHLQ